MNITVDKLASTEPDESAESVLGGIQIIDCDSHWTEPPDLWTSRVPESQRHLVPTHRTFDGATGWYLNDQLWSGLGGNTIGVGHSKLLGEHTIQPFSAIDESSWQVSERLALMDEVGVHAAINYPNGIGFASNHIFAIEDAAQRQLVLQTYNDHLVDVQRESGERILPQAILPIWDMALTVKEMTRLMDQRIRGFTLSDKPELLGLPELDRPYFEPMWDLASQTGVVMNFHIGSGGVRARTTGEHTREELARPSMLYHSELFWSSFGRQRRLAVQATQMNTSNMRIIANLCMSNLFDRFPGLKIVSAESGIGWIPYVLEALEYQLDEMVTDPGELTLQQRRPTEYFKDHIYVTFWFERSGPQRLIDVIGADNILAETDIPHPTCLFPGTRQHFASVLKDHEPSVIRKILQGNAAKLYRIEID